MIKLNDYDLWKAKNENRFTYLDYASAVIEWKEISTDFFFVFLELFWPTFIEYEGMIFVKNQFEAKKKSHFKNTNKSKENEYWINLINIDSIFEGDLLENEKQTYLVSKMGESWKLKLKKDFPNKEFSVHVIDNEDDVAITFHQEWKD